jgi:ATP-binding cassette subfamily B protein
LNATLLLQALQPAAAAAATGALISAVSGTAANSGRSWIWPLALLGGTLLAGQGADPFSSMLRSLAARRIDGERRTVLSRLAADTSGIAPLENPAVRDDLLLASARPSTNWTESTPGQAAVAQLRLLFRIVQATACAVVLLQYSWWLVLLMLVAVLGTRAVLSSSTLAITELAAHGMPAARRERYWRDQAIAPGPAKEIRVFRLRSWVTGHWRDAFLDRVGPVWHRGSELSTRQWTAFLALTASAFAGFTALGLGAVHGGVSTGGLGAMLAAVIGLLSLAASDHDTVAAVGGLPSMGAMERLRRQLGHGSEAAPPDTAVPGTAGPDTTADPPLIRFEGVGFRYPGAGRPVLEGCDLEIRPGEVLALVGSNGAGKTTMAKLLTGLYRPDAGSITADGRDIATIAPGSWRRRLAAVFQDFVQYPLPVIDNIALGAPFAAYDRAALIASARDAGSEELIQRLPATWDTPLSTAFTGGVDLSGGQWQHIALTRAMLAIRAGAQVLVLDEPTAHLDVRTELEVFRRVIHGLPNVTVVLISHRLSTLRHADRIACLAGGRVVETGSHEELIAMAGVYADLFADQAADRRALEVGPDDVAGGTT